MGAGPRLETKLQPGPSEDTRRPFDARQALRPRRARISVFTVSPILYRRFFFFLFLNKKYMFLQFFFQNSPLRMCCCSDVSGLLTSSLEVKKKKNPSMTFSFVILFCQFAFCDVTKGHRCMSLSYWHCYQEVPTKHHFWQVVETECFSLEAINRGLNMFSEELFGR